MNRRRRRIFSFGVQVADDSESVDVQSVPMFLNIDTDYTSNLKDKLKVLDFVKSGGPILTVGRTVFEMWLGSPSVPVST